ncbi:MAG: DHH family phosphoesterase [Candidatus Micrarchaeota archaeon]|nr:DHH family phosphoesterase [Candidatus Micrarchaeota archaeon]
MELLTFDGLKSLLEEHKEKRVMLTFHSIGDTDSVSSAFALSEYMKNATIATPDFITNNCKRMLQRLGFRESMIKTEFDDGADLIIMLDVNNFEECGPFAERLAHFGKKILVIDHHARNEISGHDVLSFNDEGYNSTTSIVYDALERLGHTVGGKTAALIAIGIISDSADFINSFPKTFTQVGKLLETSGMGYSELLENIRHVASPESRLESITGLFGATAEVRHKLLFVYGRASFHANHFADNALKVGADVSIFYAITGNDVTFSARLRSPLDKELGIHLGVIMRDLAPVINGTGGGHPCAAGVYGKVSGDNYKELINRFISEIGTRSGQSSKHRS